MNDAILAGLKAGIVVTIGFLPLNLYMPIMRAMFGEDTDAWPTGCALVTVAVLIVGVIIGYLFATNISLVWQ